MEDILTYNEIYEMISDAIHQTKQELSSDIDELQINIQNLECRLDNLEDI